MGAVQGYGQQELTFVEPVSQRKVSETWLVLEYCSKGSLQDALDRYDLWKPSSAIYSNAAQHDEAECSTQHELQ